MAGQILYENGVAIDANQQFGVVETKPGVYQGKKPLTKITSNAVGCYGGNICGQALVVAIETAKSGFKPHSVHGYFVSPVFDTLVIEWHVEKISDGSNFCNRKVRGYQNGILKYIALVSLTKRNSNRIAQKAYDDYHKKLAEKKAQKSANKGGNSDNNNDSNINNDADDDDDDDDDDDGPQKPFGFQTPYNDVFKKNPVNQIKLDPRGVDILCFHKIPQTNQSARLPVTQKSLSWYARWGINEQNLNYQLKNVDEKFQAFGLSVIAESLFITRLSNSLVIDDKNLSAQANYWAGTLDHIIYFHDDDFDTTQWMGVSTKPLRFVNKRAICEAEIYNSNGVHVATCFQEAIIHLDRIADNAKL